MIAKSRSSDKETSVMPVMNFSISKHSSRAIQEQADRTYIPVRFDSYLHTLYNICYITYVIL